jgi:steroid delta-isomerase
MERDNELTLLRVAGNEAAFGFRLTVKAAGSGMVIEPIVVMALSEDPKVAAMKAYWSPNDVTPL